MALNGGFETRLDLGCGAFASRRWTPGGFGVVAPLAGVKVFEVSGHLDALNLSIPRGIYLDHLAASGVAEGDVWYERLARCGTADRLVRSLMETLWEEIERPQHESALFTEQALALLLIRLTTLGARPPEPRRGGLAPWAERRCREYLRDHLADDVTLAELAAVARLSPFHLARMFKISTGLPPHAYQRRLRCERAQALLRETDLPVTEIALAVGYATPQAFARMFLAETGATPSAWRRDRRG